MHVPLIVRWPGTVKAGSATDALISGEDLAPTFLEAAGAPVPPEMTGRSFVKLLRGEPFEPRQYVFSEPRRSRTVVRACRPFNSANFDLGRVVIGKRYKLIYTATWQIPYTPVDFAGDPFWKELACRMNTGRCSSAHGAGADLLLRPRRADVLELYDLETDPQRVQQT